MIYCICVKSSRFWMSVWPRAGRGYTHAEAEQRQTRFIQQNLEGLCGGVDVLISFYQNVYLQWNNPKIIFHSLSKTSTVVTDSTEALCSPLVERASLEQSSSADHPPASPFSSPGPSHISAPPGSALPGKYPENKMFLKSKHLAVQAITWSPNVTIHWEL